MPSKIKLFKFALPVATATTAAIATIYLIATWRKEQERKVDEDSLLDNIELTTEKFEEEIINQQQDQSQENEDNEGESASEKEKKVKDLIEKESTKEERQAVVQKLLNNADELAKQISKDGNIQVSAEEIKEILEKELGLPEQDKGDNQDPLESKEAEAQSPSGEESEPATSQENPESVPEESLDASLSEETEKENLLSKSPEGEVQELADKGEETDPLQTEQLDNEKSSLPKDSAKDLEEVADVQSETPSDEKEGEIQKEDVSDSSQKDLTSQESEDLGDKVEQAADGREEKPASSDDSEGTSEEAGGVLDEAGQQTDLDREQQLAELEKWHGKLEEVLSSFGSRFNFR